MKIIDENKDYSLRLEFMQKRSGGWWLERIERGTGKAKIVMHQDKTFFDGLNLANSKNLFRHVEAVKMYKAGKV